MNTGKDTIQEDKSQEAKPTKCKTMMRVSHNRKNPYTMINSQALRDVRLSAKARGIWAFLLTFPDDWEINMTHLIKSFPEGRKAINSGINELIEKGYMIRLQYYGCKEHGTHGF